MQETKDTILLTLSGTVMSGFTCKVPRDWALRSTNDDIIAVFRTNLLDLVTSHDMYDLIRLAKETKLHIHTEFNENSERIYICQCPTSNATKWS